MSHIRCTLFEETCRGRWSLDVSRETGLSLRTCWEARSTGTDPAALQQLIDEAVREVWRGAQTTAEVE